MSFQPRTSIVSIQATLMETTRPRLLLRAARIGTIDYQRERDLKRILRLPVAPPPGPGVVLDLLALEAEHEERRTRPLAEMGDAWRPAHHVEALIALLAEAALMVRPAAPPAPCPA